MNKQLRSMDDLLSLKDKEYKYIEEQNKNKIKELVNSIFINGQLTNNINQIKELFNIDLELYRYYGKIIKYTLTNTQRDQEILQLIDDMDSILKGINIKIAISNKSTLLDWISSLDDGTSYTKYQYIYQYIDDPSIKLELIKKMFQYKSILPKNCYDLFNEAYNIILNDRSYKYEIPLLENIYEKIKEQIKFDNNQSLLNLELSLLSLYSYGYKYYSKYQNAPYIILEFNKNILNQISHFPTLYITIEQIESIDLKKYNYKVNNTNWIYEHYFKHTFLIDDYIIHNKEEYWNFINNLLEKDPNNKIAIRAQIKYYLYKINYASKDYQYYLEKFNKLHNLILQATYVGYEEMLTLKNLASKLLEYSIKDIHHSLKDVQENAFLKDKDDNYTRNELNKKIAQVEEIRGEIVPRKINKSLKYNDKDYYKRTLQKIDTIADNNDKKLIEFQIKKLNLIKEHHKDSLERIIEQGLENQYPTIYDIVYLYATEYINDLNERLDYIIKIRNTIHAFKNTFYNNDYLLLGNSILKIRLLIAEESNDPLTQLTQSLTFTGNNLDNSILNKYLKIFLKKDIITKNEIETISIIVENHNNLLYKDLCYKYGSQENIENEEIVEWLEKSDITNRDINYPHIIKAYILYVSDNSLFFERAANNIVTLEKIIDAIYEDDLTQITYERLKFLLINLIKSVKNKNVYDLIFQIYDIYGIIIKKISDVTEKEKFIKICINSLRKNDYLDIDKSINSFLKHYNSSFLQDIFTADLIVVKLLNNQENNVNINENNQAEIIEDISLSIGKILDLYHDKAFYYGRTFAVVIDLFTIYRNNVIINHKFTTIQKQVECFDISETRLLTAIPNNLNHLISNDTINNCSALHNLIPTTYTILSTILELEKIIKNRKLKEHKQNEQIKGKVDLLEQKLSLINNRNDTFIKIIINHLNYDKANNIAIFQYVRALQYVLLLNHTNEHYKILTLKILQYIEPLSKQIFSLISKTNNKLSNDILIFAKNILQSYTSCLSSNYERTIQLSKPIIYISYMQTLLKYLYNSNINKSLNKQEINIANNTLKYIQDIFMSTVDNNKDKQLYLIIDRILPDHIKMLDEINLKVDDDEIISNTNSIKIDLVTNLIGLCIFNENTNNIRNNIELLKHIMQNIKGDRNKLSIQCKNALNQIKLNYSEDIFKLKIIDEILKEIEIIEKPYIEQNPINFTNKSKLKNQTNDIPSSSISNKAKPNNKPKKEKSRSRK